MVSDAPYTTHEDVCTPTRVSAPTVEATAILFFGEGPMSTKRTVKARHAVNDIRTGMTDSELMQKYGLSAKGLQRLFLKLLQVKAITQSELNRRSESFLDTMMIEQMEGADMLEDLRSGTSNSELMEKYGLSAEGLQRAFQKLIQEEAIAEEELSSTSQSEVDTVSVEDKRKTLRQDFAVEVAIYELRRPTIKGALVNVTRKGVAIKGIQSNIGDVMTLVIPAVNFIEVNPIRLDAQCKWAAKDAITGEWHSGFEIIGISQTCSDDLKKIVQAAAVLG